MAILAAPRRYSRLCRLAAFGLSALAGLAARPAIAADAITQPQEIRAVFLLNLTRFVRWPEAAFKAEDAPLVVGFLEGDPVGSTLEEAVHGEMVGKHPIQTRRLRSPADLEGCQVVYFAKEYFPGAAQMLALLKEKPVLTVSDADGFLTLGGHIQFYNRTGQVKIRLNLPNLKRAELTASSQLLRVAETK